MLTESEEQQAKKAIIKIEEYIGQKTKELQAKKKKSDDIIFLVDRSDEKKLREEIVQLEWRRELLRSVLSGEIDLSAESWEELSKKAVKILYAMDHLTKLVRPLQEKMANIVEARALISRHS